MSTFSGLNAATTALWAQQRAIEVIGQNVANVNTDGYSRQRADLQSIAGNSVPALWSTSGQVGGGVEADQVVRVRDAFLEARARNEHGVTASLTVQDDTYTAVQNAFREPGDTGLQKQLNDMWSGWGDVMNNSLDAGARKEVVQRTATLVAGLRTTYGTLTNEWQNNRDAMRTLVDEVNATAASIANLNRAIKSASLSDHPANELADKRDALILHLSDQIGATATARDDGTVDVVVGGTSIVSGTSTVALQLTGATGPATATSSPPRIVTADVGTELRVGGTALGHITAMTSILPTYLKNLDGLAQQIADQVNGLQAAGFDQDGYPGAALLTDENGGTTGITAENLTLFVSDARRLAAAGLPPTSAGPPPTGASADNGNAAKLYAERLNPTGADTTYRQQTVGLGVDAAKVSTALLTQTAISTRVDSAREGVSGVSIDEEMTNMLQFQHGYAAAARLVTAIDSMLDTLINHTGLVGQA